MTHFIRGIAAALALAGIATMAAGHGDVAPQPVNTDALPDVGEEWLIENPYRADKVGEEIWAKAVEIGDSAYNQNCARCHGLGVVSGGLAPDLRFLEASEYGDEWFVERRVDPAGDDGAGVDVRRQILVSQGLWPMPGKTPTAVPRVTPISA